MFVVYEGFEGDDGQHTLKKAQHPDCNVDPSWANCKFDNFEEAVSYANKWLGIYGPGPDYQFKVGVPFIFSGSEFGYSFVIIKEELK